MKNKKIMLSMMIVITILLVIIFLGVILNITNPTIMKNINNRIFGLDSNEISYEEIYSLEDFEKFKTASVSRNEFITAIVSRSEIQRQNSQNLYVNLNDFSQDDYEEVREYIKLENVKISFDMDVSKTTGLSQEDFVKLVQNMKYDKTGILEKNAAWIWECCQKYNVNEIFVLGICGIESGWCSAPQHQSTHNYSSLMQGGKLIAYSSDEAGFEAMIKLLGQKYLSPKGALYKGKTITAVGTRYCNTTTWPPKVYKCMKQVFN